MALAVLVVDGDAAVEQVAELRRSKRLRDRDRKQRLHLIQEEAAVAIGAGDQRFASFGRDGKGALLDRFRAAHQLLERLMIEPPQDQHLAAREKRGIDLEARVLGGRANQGDGAVLDIGQEAVLLRAVEAMDLVDEQQRLLTGLAAVPGLGENLLEVGDARKHSGNGDEPQTDGVGEQPCDAGLAGSRRPPQDHRGEAAGGDHPPDRAVGTGQMLLPDDLVERRRPQSVGERRVRRRRFGRPGRNFLVGEQVGHRDIHNSRGEKCTSRLA